jgi:putative serine protease PepD
VFSIALRAAACETPPAAPAPAAAAAPATAPSPTAAPAAAPVAPAADGARPGLGLMPDYAAGGDGVLVASVREGGSADRAGIRDGDRIVELNGIPVQDPQSYSDALGDQVIGATVPVVLVRGTEKVTVQVVVGARGR